MSENLQRSDFDGDDGTGPRPIAEFWVKQPGTAGEKSLFYNTIFIPVRRTVLKLSSSPPSYDRCRRLPPSASRDTEKSLNIDAVH